MIIFSTVFESTARLPWCKSFSYVLWAEPERFASLWQKTDLMGTIVKSFSQKNTTSHRRHIQLMRMKELPQLPLIVPICMKELPACPLMVPIGNRMLSHTRKGQTLHHDVSIHVG